MDRTDARPQRGTRLLSIIVAIAGIVLGVSPARAEPPVKATVTSCTEVGLLAEIAGAAAGDEIAFDCGGPATIALSQTLVLTRALRIDGEGLITLTRGGQGRVISVTSAVTAADPAELAGLTIVGGVSSGPGGAILNEGALVLEDVVLAENRAQSGGAVHTTGPLRATRATFARNQASASGGAISSDGAGRATLIEVRLEGNSAGASGGAISAGAPITITTSVLQGNTAESGGALSVGATTADLRDSELRGNAARAAGGALANAGTVALSGVAVAENSAAAGGGISSSGALTLRGSTVSGNRSTGDGAGISSSGALTLSGVTVAANQAGGGGGGVYIPAGSASARGSILAGNSALAGLDCLGLLGSAGGNLVQHTGGCVISPAGDIVGVDPQLLPLADNGGPSRTHALPQGSPAVNAVAAASCAELVDQRGVNRPVGASCDIGAYELGFVVNSLEDAPDQNPVTPECAASLPGAPCTLRAAIQQANSLFGRQAISFSVEGTFTLSPAIVEAEGSPDLDITQDLIILGRGAGRTVISGGGSAAVGGLLDIGAGAHVTISGVSLRDGNAGAANQGGAIRSTGTLTLTDSVVANSRTADSAGRGGGIASSGALHLARVTISGNTSGNGGGIDSSGALSILDSTISGNTSTAMLTGGGGGVNSQGAARLTNVTISGNSATNSGGGLAINGGGPGAVRLNNLTIAGNAADTDGDGVGDGGGLFMRLAPNVTLMSNTIITGNLDGGGQLRPDCAGSLISLGYNLLRINNDCVETAGPGDWLGLPGSPVDARLGAIGANGGPTQTYRLLSDSPAINGGSPAAAYGRIEACAATDQRGGARPIGARCDIGASEVPLADLRLAQSAVSGGAAIVGRELSYLITVSNDGPSATGGVALTMTMPNAVLTAGSSSRGVCAPTQGGVSCTIGVLAGGESATISLSVRPLRPGSLPTHSSVVANEADPSTTNNSAGAQFIIQQGLMLPMMLN